MQQIDLKKLKPIGIVVILGTAILAFIVCFTGDMGVPKKYVSRHDTQYYRQSEATMEELLSELREDVFPSLDGIKDSYVTGGPENRTVAIVVDKENYDKVKAVVSRDFDSSLFEFIKSTG